MSPEEEAQYYQKAYQREKLARKEAEQILESKAEELYQVNKKLLYLNANLEQELIDRLERIKEAEEKYSQLVETANDVIFRVNLTGEFTYMNNKGIQLSGYSKEEIIGRSFTFLVKPEFREQLIKLYQNQLLKEIPSTYVEYTIETKTGEEIWLGQNVQLILENGFPVEFLSVTRDITERVKSDNELKRSKEKYKKMFEGVFDGVMRMDIKGNFLEWNTKMELMLEYSAEELLAMNIEDIVHHEDREKSKKYFLKLLDEGYYANYTGRIVNKSGKIIPVEVNSTATYEDGKFSGAIDNIRDISERVAIEEAIVKSEEKYRGIIENLELGLLEVGVDGLIRKVYPSFCKLSGYKEEDLVGRKPREFLLHPDSRAVMDSEDEKRLRGEASVYEVQIQKKNGDYKWVIISGAPYYNDKGEFAGSVGVHLDITQRKKLEDELKSANQIARASSKAKELFLANMSHEIRTPLNAVIGLSNLLKKTILDDTQTDYVTNINNAASSLLLLVNDILDISKIESGKLEFDRSNFDLRKSLRTILSSGNYLAEKKGLILTLNVDENLKQQYYSDELKISQVLINLMNNAIKFTADGEVIISVTKVESSENFDCIEFDVTDTGKGIAEEALNTIFDDFSQEDNTISKKFGGTGLGLSISKKLVAALGGDLTVKSELGKGTTFAFRLNMEHAEADEEAQEEVKVNINWNRVKILTVEDNPVNQFVVQETLKGWGASTDLAENGEIAVELLAEVDYDLVLMDLQMPVMDGIAATKFIRQDMGSKVPIIAFTANALKRERERCLSVGMNDYIPKPFQEDVLKAKMIYLLLKSSNKQGLAIIPENQISKEPKEPLFTTRRLDDLARGNSNFVTKMIKIFVDEGEKQILEFTPDNDPDVISKVAHKIKPSIDYLSNERMKQLVRQIEDKEFKEEPELLSEFRDDLEKLLKKAANHIRK